MMAEPCATAVTNPDAGSTVATAALELLQVPPLVPLVVKVAAWLMQSEEGPLMLPALTLGDTVTGAVALAGAPQPLLRE